MQEIKNYTQDEWHREGIKRFGLNIRDWKFVCPSCGHVQSVSDFEKYKDRGVTANTAFFNCIGRYEAPDNDILSGQRPCNYTTGGLFNLSPVIITDYEGKDHPAFDFA